MSMIIALYEEEYETQRRKWLNGEISNEVWLLYCMDCLNSIMTWYRTNE